MCKVCMDFIDDPELDDPLPRPGVALVIGLTSYTYGINDVSTHHMTQFLRNRTRTRARIARLAVPCDADRAYGGRR